MSKYYIFSITLLISVSFLQSATIPKKGGNVKHTNVNIDALFQFPEIKSEAIDAVFKDTEPKVTEIKNEEKPEEKINPGKFYEEKHEKEQEKEKDEHYEEKYKEKEEDKHEYYEEQYKENKDKHDEDKYEEKDDHYEEKHEKKDKHKYGEEYEEKDKHKYGEEYEEKDEHDEHDEYDSDEEVEDICYHGKCVPHKLCHKEVHGFSFCEHDYHVCCDYKDIKI